MRLQTAIGATVPYKLLSPRGYFVNTLSIARAGPEVNPYNHLPKSMRIRLPMPDRERLRITELPNLIFLYFRTLLIL